MVTAVSVDMPANTSTVRAGAPEDADIRRRRERKRATDRAAQREHRRRQKLYVEDLEAQLALVRGGSLDDQLAQVMRENGKLRAEVPFSIERDSPQQTFEASANSTRPAESLSCLLQHRRGLGHGRVATR